MRRLRRLNLSSHSLTGSAMRNAIHSLALDKTPARRLLGLGVVVLGFVLLAIQAYSAILAELTPAVRRALEGGAMGALATALGAAPVLAMRRIPVRLADGLLGFGAGVMLAATAFSLIVPGLAAAREVGFDKWGAGALVSAGVVAGVLALLWFDRVMPHVHFDAAGHETRSEGPSLSPRVLLFVMAIALHNIPEGMAVGVAIGAGAPGASGLATGIALQDVPEGLVVALALAGAGLGRAKAAFVGALTGLVEPLFAALAAIAVSVSTSLLPWGLAFAAGAMLFAVSHEIIPESHRNGHERDATLGLAIGFCVMMVMDTALA